MNFLRQICPCLLLAKLGLKYVRSIVFGQKLYPGLAVPDVSARDGRLELPDETCRCHEEAII